MNLFLIFIAIVIITCVMLNNATNRVGVPVLLAFILLGMLFCLVVKPDGSQQVPVGDTLLEDGDSVILCTKAYDGKLAIPVREHTVSAHSRWDGIPVRDYPSGHDRLILIRRDGKDIIPHGDTLIHAGDHLYINRVQDVRDTAMAYHNKNNNHTLSK